MSASQNRPHLLVPVTSLDDRTTTAVCRLSRDDVKSCIARANSKAISRNTPPTPQEDHMSYSQRQEHRSAANTQHHVEDSASKSNDADLENFLDHSELDLLQWSHARALIRAQARLINSLPQTRVDGGDGLPSLDPEPSSIPDAMKVETMIAALQQVKHQATELFLTQTRSIESGTSLSAQQSRIAKYDCVREYLDQAIGQLGQGISGGITLGLQNNQSVDVIANQYLPNITLGLRVWDAVRASRASSGVDVIENTTFDGVRFDFLVDHRHNLRQVQTYLLEKAMRLLQGHNVLITGYGTSGSGKSTMLVNQDALLTQVLERLATWLGAADASKQRTLSCKLVEVSTLKPVDMWMTGQNFVTSDRTRPTLMRECPKSVHALELFFQDRTKFTKESQGFFEAKLTARDIRNRILELCVLYMRKKSAPTIENEKGSSRSHLIITLRTTESCTRYDSIGHRGHRGSIQLSSSSDEPHYAERRGSTQLSPILHELATNGFNKCPPVAPITGSVTILDAVGVETYAPSNANETKQEYGAFMHSLTELRQLILGRPTTTGADSEEDKTEASKQSPLSMALLKVFHSTPGLSRGIAGIDDLVLMCFVKDDRDAEGKLQGASKQVHDFARELEQRRSTTTRARSSP